MAAEAGERPVRPDAAPPAVTRLGVLGWPVAHSRSPAMQNAALAAVGLGEWRYQLLPVPPEAFGETVRALPELGFVGANVTIPHKPAALEVADVASERARAIGAANTLVFGADGRIRADNTDGPGLVAALTARGIELAGASVQLLGAGGTARAALWCLREAGARVRVWNRTRARAEALCAELGGEVVDEPRAADVLVQATSTGLMSGSELPDFKALRGRADGIGQFSIVTDFVYTREGGRLLSLARQQGVTVVDGLELLVRQGALSFEAFCGRPAPVEIMDAAVRT